MSRFKKEKKKNNNPVKKIWLLELRFITLARDYCIRRLSLSLSFFPSKNLLQTHVQTRYRNTSREMEKGKYNSREEEEEEENR